MRVLNIQCSLPDSNWNPARREFLPNEIRFYEEKLKLQQFTGIKGPIRKI
jgi:hypothetical protein